MANNTTNSDKYFFRNETLPSNTDLPRDVTWAEGHRLERQTDAENVLCSVCNEKSDEGMFKCSGMPLQTSYQSFLAKHARLQHDFPRSSSYSEDAGGDYATTRPQEY